MKSFLLFSVFVLMVISFSNCKKSKNAATAKVDTPFIYGYLSVVKQAEQLVIGDTFGNYAYAKTYFLGDSISKVIVKPANVIVMGDTLGYPGSNNVAYSNLFPPDLPSSINWSVQGSGPVPTFSFSLPGAFPDYFGDIPDTIFLVNGVTLKFNSGNYINADTVFIRIDNNSTSNSYIIASNPAKGDVTITSSELEHSINNPPSPPGENLYLISVFIMKHDYTVVNGKLFQFVRERWISHPLHVL